MQASVFSAVGCLLTGLVNQWHHSSGEAKENLPALWRCGINIKVWQDETSAGGLICPTSCLCVFSLILLCCVFLSLCDKQHRVMSGLPFFEGKLIFWDLRGNRSSATISISILVDTFALNVYSHAFAGCVRSLWRPQINSSAALAAQMVQRVHSSVPAGIHHIDAGRRWTRYTVDCSAHPSSPRQGHPNIICPPWHLPPAHPAPLNTTLSATSLYWFQVFPQLISFVFWKTIQSSWTWTKTTAKHCDPL